MVDAGRIAQLQLVHLASKGTSVLRILPERRKECKELGVNTDIATP
jgi:hypothetical protein